MVQGIQDSGINDGWYGVLMQWQYIGERCGWNVFFKPNTNTNSSSTTEQYS